MKLSDRTKKISKTVLAGSLLAVYWFFINQKIISGTDQVYGLLGFFLLMCTATAYFPLPANLLVLGAVKSFDPLLVAFIAALGTIVAYLSEYILFTCLFRLKTIASFKETWIYKKVAPLFDRNQFFILSFTSFLPIPAEPVRIYAITRKYGVLAFLAAGFVGRMPRYFLLGYFGQSYVNSVWFLAAVFVFPAVFLLAIRGTVSLANLVRLRLETRRMRPSAVPLSVPVSAEETASDLQSSDR